MSKYIITFPGQGSQSIGMMDGLAHIPIIKKTFIEASEILNKDFWAMVSSDNKEINQTVNTQPLMLTAGVATWRYLQENNLGSPSFLAGHSLGEFTALVAANSLSFINFEHPLALAATRKIIRNSSIAALLNFAGQLIPFKIFLLFTRISAIFSPL